MSIKAIQEEQSEARNAIVQLRDTISAENRDFTTEERTAWDEANASYDSCKSRLDVFKRAEAVAVVASTHAEKQERQAFDLRTMEGGKEYHFPLSRQVPRSETEARAHSTTTDSEGGYLVPTDLLNEIEVALLAFGGVREVARVIRTESGNQLDLPTVNDTGNPGSIAAENGAVSETDITFGVKNLNAYKVSSDLVKIPFELLQDSDFNLAQLLGEILGERIARKAGALYTTGTGSSQPNGVVTASATGVTAAGVAAITADEVISVFHSLGRAYRRNGTWMFNDTTAQLLRKLKDSDNQYIWQPGLQAGQPDILLGRPVVINDDMASPAASAKSILFGDFSRYWIRDVGGVRLRRLNERFADNDQIGFVGFLRTDGELANAGTNPLVNLTQAAS